jgi:curved DNA-binding protein CbpA
VSHARIRDLNGQDPYVLLGVDRTADREEIARAYRRQIQRVHPDRRGGDEDAAKLLHVARAVLLDADLRAEYDLSLTGPGPVAEPLEAEPVRRPPRQFRVSRPVPARIGDNMTMSIIAMFIFFPSAIPAVVYASKARDAIRAGDHAAAASAAQYSRFFSRLSFLLGSTVLGALCCLCLFMSALTSPVIS